MIDEHILNLDFLLLSLVIDSQIEKRSDNLFTPGSFRLIELIAFGAGQSRKDY
jgi:hypothetical protein